MAVRIPVLVDLEAMKQRHYAPAVVAVYGFISGSLAIGMLAWMAHLAHSPLIFPSLGPTAFLLFYHPLDAAASPRNSFLGHLIGVMAGWVSLAAFGLLGAPASVGDITWARAGAATLSIGITIGLMELWDVPHPPAGATTMIVSLGFLSGPRQMALILLAVVALLALGAVINRLVGIPYPLWRPRPPTPS